MPHQKVAPWNQMELGPESLLPLLILPLPREGARGSAGRSSGQATSMCRRTRSTPRGRRRDHDVVFKFCVCGLA